MSHGVPLPSSRQSSYAAKMRQLRLSQRRTRDMTVNLMIDGVTSRVTTEQLSVSSVDLQVGTHQQSNSHSAHIQFPDGRILPANVQWVRNGRMKLIFTTPLHRDDPLLHRGTTEGFAQLQRLVKLDAHPNNRLNNNNLTSILIAEGLLSVGFVLGATLEKHGHNVKLVSNGLSAVEAAGRHPYDLMIINSELPLIDGCAAMKTIRKLPIPHRDSAIIALANGFASCGAWVFSGVEVDRYILMPVRPAQLIMEVDAVLSDRRLMLPG